MNTVVAFIKPCDLLPVRAALEESVACEVCVVVASVYAPDSPAAGGLPGVAVHRIPSLVRVQINAADSDAALITGVILAAIDQVRAYDGEAGDEPADDETSVGGGRHILVLHADDASLPSPPPPPPPASRRRRNPRGDRPVPVWARA